MMTILKSDLIVYMVLRPAIDIPGEQPKINDEQEWTSKRRKDQIERCSVINTQFNTEPDDEDAEY